MLAPQGLRPIWRELALSGSPQARVRASAISSPRGRFPENGALRPEGPPKAGWEAYPTVVALRAYLAAFARAPW